MVFLISSLGLGPLDKLDLLTVVSGRIASVFNNSGGTRAVLDICKAFVRVWHAGLFKL